MQTIFSNFARKTIKESAMTTLLLVRHGETYDNENQIMQGQTQGQLNPRGIEQAQQLAREMAQRDIDAFVASDLNRAIETCRIIAEPHHAELITTPLLRERDWGAFTGRFIPSLKGEPFPADVESLDALLQRAQRAHQSLLQSCHVILIRIDHHTGHSFRHRQGSDTPPHNC
jgi:broad specificity phosphatase PhoE